MDGLAKAEQEARAATAKVAAAKERLARLTPTKRTPTLKPIHSNLSPLWELQPKSWEPAAVGRLAMDALDSDLDKGWRETPSTMDVLDGESFKSSKGDQHVTAGHKATVVVILSILTTLIIWTLAIEVRSEPEEEVVIDSTIDKADTTWMLVSTSLVLLMVPALGLFEAGLLRAKNTISVLLQCIAGMSVLSVLWFVCGYSLAFSPRSYSGLVGSLDQAFLHGVRCAPRVRFYPRTPHASQLQSHCVELSQLTTSRRTHAQLAAPTACGPHYTGGALRCLPMHVRLYHASPPHRRFCRATQI